MPPALSAPVLELAHLTTWAAWLAHAPCTVRALAGKSDRPLIELHPRTLELAALGALTVTGQTSDGPVYALAHAPDLNAPTATDLVERRLTTLPIRDQVSIAAGIMARHGRRSRPGARDRAQEEMPLTTSHD